MGCLPINIGAPEHPTWLALQEPLQINVTGKMVIVFEAIVKLIVVKRANQMWEIIVTVYGPSAWHSLPTCEQKLAY
jgi:hypothetical protein